jgi:EpsD family peptidyl-prolyl cis-trans isomerase
MTSPTNKFAISLLGAALALGLCACGKKDDKAAATQVAVKVGSEEISVHQLNQVLSRANTANTSPEAAQAMNREVLEKLIDQQLEVEQATESKIHRSPDVVSQLEASRREILARAYLQRIVSALPKPTPAEMKKYYADNPQLFAQRRVFNMQEIVVPAAAGVSKDLQAFASSGKPLEEVVAWLKEKGIKFGANSATRPAEQIPMELLASIQPLKDGQSIVVQAPQADTLLRVASSQLAPVTEAVALPSIEQFLGNQRAKEAVAANLKQLRADTKITYMGEFAKKDAATATAPVTPPAASASAAVDKDKSVIEKGIAGFK